MVKLPTPAVPLLTVSDLLTRGYFHDRVIPPLVSTGLAPAVGDLIDFVKKGRKRLRSRCTHHSVPKRKHLRRLLSIPNPLHYTALAREVEKYWAKLQTHCEKSRISLSIPRLSVRRALESTYDINQIPVQRALRSVGARYLLRTDFARFYPSIYTHSVGWAIHGKDVARANKTLYGNVIDAKLSDIQDRQTGGIPIGPDTSFLIGEVMGSAIDARLQARVKKVSGVRYIDDYYLYFSSLTDAERALSLLHKIAKEFDLEVNDQKTEIVALPEELEPGWKTELRTKQIRPTGSPQATDLVALFNRGFDLSQKFPTDNVMTYIARQVRSATIDADNWELCEALLMRAALAEPTMLSVVLEILEANAAIIGRKDNIQKTVASLCEYHAPLQQGFEVAWALWLARQQGLTVPQKIADLVCGVEDDIVALVALDLRDAGLFPNRPSRFWDDVMAAPNLYTEHWLLAYEALEQLWLPSKSGQDYVGADPVFEILRNHAGRFYDASLIAPPASSTGYENEDEEDVAATELLPEHFEPLLTP